jgi:DNA primase
MTEVGVDVKILKVTGGAKDPDEYIKKYGPESFRRLMTGASGQIDYRLSEIIGKYNIDIPEEKLSMIEEACALVAGVYPEMKREVYILRLSELTGIGKDTIAADIKRRTRRMATAQKKEIAKSGEEALRHYGDRINPDAMKSIKGTSAEEQILGILLLYPEYFARLSSDILCENDFVTEFNKSVFCELKGLYDAAGAGEVDLSALNEIFSPEQMGRIHAMYRKRRALTVNDLQTLIELCAVLKKEKQKMSATPADKMSVDELSAYLAAKRSQSNENK